jgi:ABC-type polysaccharide/polyol phosphate export permease
MFASPIAYSARLLSEPWRTLYGINPMVGVGGWFSVGVVRQCRGS